MSNEKKPLDQALELMLYAPIGFALEARKLLPSFVERGRNQVQMAKMVGQFAVKHGQNEAEARIGKVQVQAEAVLAEFGLGAAPPASRATPTDTETAAQARAQADAEVDAVVALTPVRATAAESAELPIADYDSLAASQVIPRLSGLEPEELAAVKAYELAHRGRKTILGKVAQLSGE